MNQQAAIAEVDGKSPRKPSEQKGGDHTRKASALRFRFGLRTLLVVTTAACVVLALVAEPLAEARRQRALLDEVLALGDRFSRVGYSPEKPSRGQRILAIFDSSFDDCPAYRIDLAGTQAADDDVARVMQLPFVRQLDLNGSNITDNALRQIAKPAHIRRLDLAGTAVTDQGISYLHEAHNLGWLRVVKTDVTYEALERLDAALPLGHFCEQRAIEELKAAGVQIVNLPRWIVMRDGEMRDGEMPDGEMPDGEMSDGGANVIVGGYVVTAGMKAVHAIVMNRRPSVLTDAEVRRLGYLQSLESMNLHSAALGPKGLISLPQLAKLERLSIRRTNLDNADLASLAKQTQLEELWIGNCDEITDEGLASLNGLVNLRTLTIVNCEHVSRESIEALRQATMKSP